MDPQNPTGTPPQDNNQLLSAINSLKEDLTKEIDSRFSQYDDKFGKVEQVSEVLTKAQEAQQAEIERRKQLEEQQKQGHYIPKDWTQLRQDAANDAYEKMRKEQEEEQQRQQRESNARKSEEQELDAQLDRDMDKLEKSGYLPARHNPNDYNDPGVTARRELLSRAAYLETPALEKIADELTMAHRNNQVWNPEKKSWESAENTIHPLPGKYAPVGNSSVSGGSPGFSGPTSKELRELSMEQLAALAPQRGFGPVPVSVEGSTGF